VQYDQFIGQVQSRARLPSREEAERAAEATLATLAERLAEGEAQHLTAQLPEELARRVRAGAGETAEKFDVREFFQRVAQKEGVEPPTAAFHARAVVEVWCEAVTEGQVRDVRSQLPGEFAPLFEAGSEGKMA
jgi:uncharacterized protein (DUF2267 family)